MYFLYFQLIFKIFFKNNKKICKFILKTLQIDEVWFFIHIFIRSRTEYI